MTLWPNPIYYEYGDLTGKLPKNGAGPLHIEVALEKPTVDRGEAVSIVLKATNSAKTPLAVQPATSATGTYPLGLVALTPQGNRLVLQNLAVKADVKP